RCAPRPALAGVLGQRALEPPLARAARPHAAPEARGCGFHPSKRRGSPRALAPPGIGAAPTARGGRRDGAPLPLRAALLDLRHLPDARSAARPPSRPPGVVAPDGEDVRVRRAAGGGRGGEPSGSGVRGLRPRVDRGTPGPTP